VLPAGEDPDTFVRKHGRAGYAERLRQSVPWLDFLLDRAAARYDLKTAEGKARYVQEMLPVGARLAERTRRELFAEALAGRAGVTSEAVLGELRKTATQSPVTRREMPSFGQVTKAEKGLIWLLVHRPTEAVAAVEALEPQDLEGLAARSVLDLTKKLNEDKGFSPSVLLERLTMVEAQLVTGVASEAEPPVHDAEGCARIIRRLRYERERAAVQREIDRLQQLGAAQHGEEIDALWSRKRDLLHRIEALI
jgi:DNA primase